MFVNYCMYWVMYMVYGKISKYTIITVVRVFIMDTSDTLGSILSF